ncbi:MAG: hypothetical protein KIH62_005145 [Candidatus Kerfeldbacteria bacterium]|nr:hypothetical protein [Candidatus Kerfeldbacteria bacterium]
MFKKIYNTFFGNVVKNPDPLRMLMDSSSRDKKKIVKDATKGAIKLQRKMIDSLQ